MNTNTIKILSQINTDFYRKNGVSFSQTRKSPWSGWLRCLEIVSSLGFGSLRDAGLGDCSDASLNDCRDTGHDGHQSLLVFDLACGNLRFETFLSSALPEATLKFYAVDNCDLMVPQLQGVDYQGLDILNLLQNDLHINDQLDAPLCDLSVSFGFLHHVPLREYREEILTSLVRQTHSGGYVIVSLWQFMNNETLARKAQLTHQQALDELGLPELDDNDYLLGWKGIPGEYRYCHSFSEAEIDQLIESVVDYATLVARFVSDGRTDNLNTYLILRVE